MLNKKALFILSSLGILIGSAINFLFFPTGELNKESSLASIDLEQSLDRPAIALRDEFESRIGAIFRNSGQKEVDSVSVTDSVDEENQEDLLSLGWSLVGALNTPYGSKAFLVSKTGLVREVAVEDLFGDGNKVTQIKSDELIFLTKDGGYEKLRLYREAIDE